MDKNTITGLVLMFLVIAGFTWLNQPSEEEIAAAKAQQEQAAKANEKADQSDISLVADTLSADDLSRLKTSIQLYGRQSTNESGETTYALVSEDASLTLAGDKISGYIMVNGAKVDYETVNSSSDLKARNRAVAALRQAVYTYSQSGEFAKCLTGEDKTITLKNDVLKIDISTKGGVIETATLLEYDSFRGKNVELFNKDTNQFGFIFNTNSQRFDTNNYYFTPIAQNDSTVTMQLDLGGGSKWGIRYTLEKGSYMVNMEVFQENMQKIIPQNIPSLDIYWTQRMARQEQGKMFEERNSALYYKYAGGSVENLSESGNDDEETTNNLKWISFKNQFFSSVLIADSYMTGAKMQSKSIDKESAFYSDFMKDFTVSTSVDYNSASKNPANFKIFLGPNKFQLLKDYNKYCDSEELELNRLVSLGWALFRTINTYIVIPVFNWLHSIFGNMGITILVLTLLLKLVLFPLSNKSYISQAKMRLLAPDIKKIDEKYPGQENMMKAQQKKMELYSLAGASPFGGCLPMLLQMPFLIAMFTFFPSSIELRGESFLWANDLSAPDAIFSWTTHIPLISTYFGNHISLFCLLMTAVNILYTKMTMQSQQQNSQMQAMQWMMYLMPIMFLVFFNNYASGLSYYYFLSLLLTIAQNYGTRLFVSEEKMRARMAEAAKQPRKKSGFMARLEEAQRQQQAMLAEQQKRNNNGKGRH